MRQEDLRRLLSPYNPWWEQSDWYNRDMLLRNYFNSELKGVPRLYYHLRNITKPGAYGIVTIRGPRRVGKTTLIKLLIKDLIDNGINPQSIFFISLDYEELSDIKLVEILETISKSDEGEKYVFIDEASMYQDWAQALKNLYDMGLVENNRMKIVAAGSHSMDLAEAASKLRGRQGTLAQLFNLGGNLIHLPLRFSEVVELLKIDIDQFLSNNRFRKPKKRFTYLQMLNEGKIPPDLEIIYQKYFQLLQGVFEEYLIYGGYMKAINEYHKKGTIDRGFYSEVAELLLNDSAKAGLDPENLHRVLLRLTEQNMLSGLLNLAKPEIIGQDEEARPKGRFSLRDYLTYLRTTWTFFFAYPEEGKTPSCKPNYQGPLKNYVLDPFIYHSLYPYLNNIPDPFSHSNEMLHDDGFKGKLVESVVASHLLLAQQLFEHMPSVEYDKVLMYKPGTISGEIDFILCLMKENKQYRFQIESKYRNIPSHIQPEKGKIILTKDILEERKNMVYIPVSLFLLLF